MYFRSLGGLGFAYHGMLLSKHQSRLFAFSGGLSRCCGQGSSLITNNGKLLDSIAMGWIER